MNIESDDQANLSVQDGEQLVTIHAIAGDRAIVLTEFGQFIDVATTPLLRVRGLFFDIRQVLTKSLKHPDQEGEIIAVGTSASGKPFYKVKFSDGVPEWFSDDEVFIESQIDGRVTPGLEN